MKKSRLALAAALIAVACTSPSDRSETSSQESPSSAATDNGSISGGETGDLACWSAPTGGEAGPIQFEDATEQFGLVEPLLGMHGHAAAFGEVNGDLDPDLVVGTFGDREPEAYQERGADGPRHDQLLLSAPLTANDSWSTELGRTSGAVFADFDADGDDDLLLVRHAGVDGTFPVPSRLFENEDGTLTAHSEPLPADFRGRTPAVADYDSDGLLDLYVSEDNFGEKGGLLLHNEGSIEFADVTAGSGLEGDLSLSAMNADLNSDQMPDLATSNGVYINQGGTQFENVTPDGYVAEPIGEEDDPAGVAIGDLNRDRNPDIVIGQHYRDTVEHDSEVPVRVFLGPGDGTSGYEDVTESAGMSPLPTLAPHVAIADMDNDGWPDIVTTASASDGTTPAVYRNTGEDPLRFEVSDGLGSDQYWIGGPLVDIDRDGRLDMFAVEWEPSLPSMLFRNTGESGHWLEISIDEPGRGIGYQVTASTTNGDLIGTQEIGVGGGYSSGRLPVSHFGLGSEEAARVTITDRLGNLVDLGELAGDQHIRWPEGC